MLVLSRKIGQTIMVGDEVYITVLGVKGNQVRIGVDAPQEIAVHREEIYERIHHSAKPEPFIPVRYRRSFLPKDIMGLQGAA